MDDLLNDVNADLSDALDALEKGDSSAAIGFIKSAVDVVRNAIDEADGEHRGHQRNLLLTWLAARENMLSESWIAGAPLGRSYIDTRANGGKGITKRRAYVRLDHATAKAVPQCAGMSAARIIELLKGEG